MLDPILNALKESYQNFIDSKTLKARDPEAYARDGWWCPDEEIIQTFKNAIDEMRFGKDPEPCTTDFYLVPPPRKITLYKKYTENMAKLSEKLDENLFKLPYNVSIITRDNLRDKSQEINGIRIYDNESYKLIFTTDENGELLLWNVFTPLEI